MADFFDGKDYNSYFEKLNSRLDTENSGNKRQTVAPKSTVRRKKGFYKTFRLKKGMCLGVFLALVVALLALTVNLTAGKPNAKDNVSASENTVSQANEQVKDVPKAPQITYSEIENVAKIPQTNDAKSVVIINKNDNTIIAGRDWNKRIYPASTLKIMTLLVAVENITDMSDSFTMSLDITDPLYVEEASVAGFLDGEKCSMTDMLYGLILPSGADAAMGLAIKIAGSEEAFVELMNKKAEYLGLENTHFTNATGLFHKDNYSTAYDIAVILDAAMQNELCKKILSTYEYTTAVTPQHPEGILLRSTIFSYMYGTEPETATILGGKTGYVNEAGYCIASFGKNNDNPNEYIVVSMGNSSKWPAFYGQIDLYKQFAK